MLNWPTGPYYATDDVEVHRKRIDDAKALRLAVAARRFQCPCGGVYRVASEKYHNKSILHAKYETKLSEAATGGWCAK